MPQSRMTKYIDASILQLQIVILQSHTKKKKNLCAYTLFTQFQMSPKPLKTVKIQGNLNAVSTLIKDCIAQANLEMKSLNFIEKTQRMSSRALEILATHIIKIYGTTLNAQP